jgi:hypothetical protein
MAFSEVTARMMRRVRGILFVDYVRMLRGYPNVDWSKYLLPEDIDLMRSRIDLEAWYSMETFERFGVAILAEVGNWQLEAVRMWGRFQLDSVLAVYSTLLAPGDPRETMMRFQTLRRTFFDYDALNVVEVHDGSAAVTIAFGMGRIAEEAAAYQALGFFERLIESARGRSVGARFRSKSWKGASITRVELAWA